MTLTQRDVFKRIMTEWPRSPKAIRLLTGYTLKSIVRLWRVRTRNTSRVALTKMGNFRLSGYFWWRGLHLPMPSCPARNRRTPKITSFHDSLQANTAIFVKNHKSTFSPLRQRRLRLLMSARIIVSLISMRPDDIDGFFTCNHPLTASRYLLGNS